MKGMVLMKRDVTKTKPSLKDVDIYIDSAPKNMQNHLKELRKTIKEVAPTAKERIGYAMPYYDYKGRLAWFGFHSDYIGLYLRPPVVEQHKKELAGYVTTKSAVHLPASKKIPVALVKKLVRARMKMNDAEEE